MIPRKTTYETEIRYLDLANLPQISKDDDADHGAYGAAQNKKSAHQKIDGFSSEMRQHA